MAGRTYFAFSDFSQEGQVISVNDCHIFSANLRLLPAFAIEPDRAKAGAMMLLSGTGLASRGGRSFYLRETLFANKDFENILAFILCFDICYLT